MSDVAKWAILVAGAVTCIGLIVALPLMQHADLAVFTEAIATICNVAGDALRFGRGLVNNFLSPWGRNCLSGLMTWLLAKFLVTWTLKVSSFAYHFIFK